ncbi:hypothetical protein [Aureimonas jatrophae]|uniref:Uncharacterized protein n=1 Tax=Aureimonas jatrophae TaxID=1166073 RepID=A0A1H0FM64_9HYPH|nr:hypothetical protein [Aureimonas jatrophae]MBB3949956.1 hypothetical protein [Aureimonas jatrophae]SDN95601.1 hypothetical protein SAMN05192530_102578 [Aureimonas jatrophae]
MFWTDHQLSQLHSVLVARELRSVLGASGTDEAIDLLGQSLEASWPGGGHDLDLALCTTRCARIVRRDGRSEMASCASRFGLPFGLAARLMTGWYVSLDPDGRGLRYAPLQPGASPRRWKAAAAQNRRRAANEPGLAPAASRAV